MDRELPRTAHTLGSEYQRGGGLDVECVFEKSFDASPVRAMNRAVEKTSAPVVMCLIDGARMLSPGVFRYAMKAFRIFDRPFVYTLGMHLGPAIQNVSMLDGYNRDVEDRLLGKVDWRRDGYELFKISSLAGSSADGFWEGATESNCFCLRRQDWDELGGYDERFQSPGGGLCNLDFFTRAHQIGLTPVMLLGEATFHQFHGGASSNTPRGREHPLQSYLEEYERIKGHPRLSLWNPPHYLGHVPEQLKRHMR